MRLAHWPNTEMRTRLKTIVACLFLLILAGPAFNGVDVTSVLQKDFAGQRPLPPMSIISPCLAPGMADVCRLVQTGEAEKWLHPTAALQVCERPLDRGAPQYAANIAHWTRSFCTLPGARCRERRDMPGEMYRDELRKWTPLMQTCSAEFDFWR